MGLGVGVPSRTRNYPRRRGTIKSRGRGTIQSVTSFTKSLSAPVSSKNSSPAVSISNLSSSSYFNHRYSNHSNQNEQFNAAYLTRTLAQLIQSFDTSESGNFENFGSKINSVSSKKKRNFSSFENSKTEEFLVPLPYLTETQKVEFYNDVSKVSEILDREICRYSSRHTWC